MQNASPTLLGLLIIPLSTLYIIAWKGEWYKEGKNPMQIFINVHVALVIYLYNIIQTPVEIIELKEMF